MRRRFMCHARVWGCVVGAAWLAACGDVTKDNAKGGAASGPDAGAHDATGGDGSRPEGPPAGSSAGAGGAQNPASMGGGGGAASAGEGGGDPGGSAAGEAGAAGGAAGAGGAGPDGPEPPAVEREWATWPMPNWAGSELPHAPHYSPLEDGTVRDDVTGLVWATTRSNAVPWALALEVCQAGFRLPTIIELVSLANPQTGRADAVLGLRAQALWSASRVADSPSTAWLYYGDEGSTYTWQASMSYPAICVRGGTVSQAPHYELTDVEGTPAVRDNWTGLVWQRAASPSTYSFEDAQAYCPALAGGFRSPSVKELQTLIDRRRPAPTIDPELFPETPSARFWSGTRKGQTNGYLVEFDRGTANSYSASSSAYVRCVR
jgi:Protein of unknown function (DUF1566)